MRTKAAWMAVVVACGWASCAVAEIDEELAQTRKTIEETQDKHETIARKKEAVEDELRALQQRLTAAVETARKAEAEVAEAEEKLAALGRDIDDRSQKLDARRKTLDALVQASLRLSRTPPEAVLMMPGDSKETMQAARALKMISLHMKEEARLLAAELEEMETLKRKQVEEKNRLSDRQAFLEKERAALADEVKARKDLRRKLSSEQKETAEQMRRLAKKTANLESLLQAVEQDKPKADDAKKSARSKAPKGALRSFAATAGHIKAPASGKKIQSFGRRQGENATSKGIVLKTAARAAVVAPYDAEVVFTEAFLSYGKLVILRHGDGFHTLLSGISSVDVEAGQFLLEGEPIGAMGEGDSERKLYIELRKNNQPVDPAEWMNIR